MKVGPFTDGERDRDWLPEDIWASIPTYLHRSIEGYAARHRLSSRAFDANPAAVGTDETVFAIYAAARHDCGLTTKRREGGLAETVAFRAIRLALGSATTDSGLWVLRTAALDFIRAVQLTLLSNDATLIDFPMEPLDKLLSLLDPAVIGQRTLVLISREQLARAAFNGRYAATVGKHGDFWEQLAEVGRVRWRAGAEAVIDFLASLGLPVKGVE